MKRSVRTLSTLAIAGMLLGLTPPVVSAEHHEGKEGEKAAANGCGGKDGCGGKEAKGEKDTCKSADGKDSCHAKDGCKGADDKASCNGKEAGHEKGSCNHK